LEAQIWIILAFRRDEAIQARVGGSQLITPFVEAVCQVEAAA
jgi:hypothetical protein